MRASVHDDGQDGGRQEITIRRFRPADQPAVRAIALYEACGFVEDARDDEDVYLHLRLLPA